VEKVTAITSSADNFLVQKLRDYAALTKFRLSLTVVVSAVLGYLFGIGFSLFSPVDFLLFFAGGMMVTCASNILNEIIEKDTDRLMSRTMLRPLPTGNMTVAEAMIAAGVMGVGGVLILAFKFNLTAGVLAAVSLLSYAFIYTPLKKISPIAVFVGAIPGALPPMIGYVCACATGEINYFVASFLFAIQFLWQFPHFWSIAWVRYDDYLKAGIMMLPSASGKTRFSAVHTVIYSAVLLIVSMIPYFFNYINFVGGMVVFVFGSGFLWFSLNFYRNCDDASAKKLMFASFIYLPVVQLALVMSRF
jgi:protoheme IX farnesyltransferase